MYLSDARQLLIAAQKVFSNFEQFGTYRESNGDEDFTRFIRLLYQSGMVMCDFDGLLFDRGPGQLLFDSKVATVIINRVNLLTLRMFVHTLCRGHRATWAGYGYPYFDKAYKSGGLKAIFDRLEWFCEVAENNKSKTLHSDSELTEED